MRWPHLPRCVKSVTAAKKGGSISSRTRYPYLCGLSISGTAILTSVLSQFKFDEYTMNSDSWLKHKLGSCLWVEGVEREDELARAPTNPNFSVRKDRLHWQAMSVVCRSCEFLARSTRQRNPASPSREWFLALAQTSERTGVIAA